jgi:hypothetical protein
LIFITLGCIVYTPKDTPKYGYIKGDPMILHFKARTHIYTDKQHLEIKQASMIVQEKEPLSAVSVVTNEVTALFFYGYTTLPKSLSPAIKLRSLY